MFFNLPTAGESLDGYLYGGSIINFIGEKNESSRIDFITSDLVLFCLQIFMALILIASNKRPTQASHIQASQSGLSNVDGDEEPSDLITEDSRDTQQGQRQEDLQRQLENERSRLIARFSHSLYSFQHGLSFGSPQNRNTPLQRQSADSYSTPVCIEVDSEDWKDLVWKSQYATENANTNSINNSPLSSNTTGVPNSVLTNPI